MRGEGVRLHQSVSRLYDFSGPVLHDDARIKVTLFLSPLVDFIPVSTIESTLIEC